MGFEQLDLRPILRTGEILETVPGVIVTQHAGGGKANQYFLRGFNLDHGTDFATSVDGVPVNLPTHGHGQGYTDLNVLIPELVERVNYRKGPYYADVGDFGSAGAADLQLFETLEKSAAAASRAATSATTAALVAGSSTRRSRAICSTASTRSHDDGPWRQRDDFERTAALLRYTQGDDDGQLSLTALGYQGDWDSSDQIARSAVDRLVGRFGTLDDTTRRDSQRYSLSAAWDRDSARTAPRASWRYATYYDLGPLLELHLLPRRPYRATSSSRRTAAGRRACRPRHSLARRDRRPRREDDASALQARNDSIRNGLFDSQARNRLRHDAR